MTAAVPLSRAVLLLRPGYGSARRQSAVALAYLERTPGCALTAIAADPDAAAALVAAGAVDVVLTLDGTRTSGDITSTGPRWGEYRRRVSNAVPSGTRVCASSTESDSDLGRHHV